MNVASAKWREIVRFELVYQLRRRSTWVLFALFMFPLIGVTSDDLVEARHREILFNAPLSVAQHSVIMAMVALLILAAVVGQVATRDVQTRQEPLMHAAPVSRAAYVGGRFLGAFAVAAILLVVVPLVRMVIPLVHGGVDAEAVGPFRAAAYLQSYFLLIVPNAFVATAALFALATLMRHTLGSYIGAALLFAWTQINLDFVAETLGRWELAKLLDPTGITVLEVMTRTWAPAELNERLIGSEGALLWNRVLWLAIAFVVVVVTSRRFQFAGSADTVRWWQRGRLRATRPDRGDEAGAVMERSAPVVVPRVPREFGAASRLRQTLAIARDSLREAATRWSWLVVPFVALLFAVIRGEMETMGAGTPVLPTTHRVLESFEDMPPPVIPILFLTPILFAGELIWRERDANIDGLTDAAPVPDGARFVGKLLGLWTIVVAMHALLMLACVGAQVSLGWYDIEPALYFQILFGLMLFQSLTFALLALSVHVMVNHKHVGHVIVLLLVVVRNVLAEQFGIEHPLLVYGSDPGFGPFVVPVLWFRLYWAVWTLLIAIAARLFWVRGVNPAIRDRLRTARRRVTRRTLGFAAAALGFLLVVGGFIFYNTNVLNTYHSSAEIAERRAEYERRYRRHAGAPQPQLTATELNIELYPDQRRADVRGVYHLVNRTSQPIDTIHVAVASEVETSAIEFGRPARATLLDDDLGHRIYELGEPLQPNDSLQLTWMVRYQPRGFPARDINTDVVENGSFILMSEWMPLIGYQPRRELSDAGQRKEHGLPARPEVPSLDDLQARHNRTGLERTRLKVTVGTAADQTAVAPGELRRTWTHEGRRYFEYETAAPIGLGFAVFSADYAVRKSRAADVAIEVVHHPEHDLNVDRMIRSMEACLDQFTKRFGPYEHKVLRMVEYPAPGGNLHATSGTIWYKELFAQFDPDRDPRRINLPFAVVAHEVGHQFQPVAARVEGVGLLGESFAWYAAMGVVEKEYGDAQLQRLLRFFRRSYLTPRARADVPLLRAHDSFQSYRKGPFAMNALREYVGQEKVDLAWRRLIAKHRSGEPPFATSLDLLRELQQVTPDSLRYLLGDLFERNTFWELKSTESTAQPMPNGQWQVSLDVDARKVVVDTEGAATDVAMNDLIEIGVFAPAEAAEERGKPLYLVMHRVRTGTQKITITVPRQPARAVIDPRHLLIDVEPDDNVIDISAASLSED